MTFLRPVQLRELLGDIRFEEQILGFLRAFTSAPEVFSGLHVVSGFPGDDAGVAEDFPAP